MTKKELKKRILDCEDAIVTYRSQNSGKLKYNVVTLNLYTEYIRNKKNKSKEEEDTLLVFCWDTDSYRLLKPELVTHVVPLSAVLKGR